MEILVEVEELEGRLIGVKARKLPPDYELKKTNFHGLKEHTFREFMVEIEDYRPEDFNRDREWKEIKKKMKRKRLNSRQVRSLPMPYTPQRGRMG
jgi:hypothetical protein